MSAEKIVEGLGKQISRRAFLAKVGTSSIATLLVLLGFPRVAYAHLYEIACCHLCMAPTTPCSGDCPDSENSGQWCWYCVWAANGKSYKCCECKDAGWQSHCHADCDGVYKSYYVYLGQAPQPGG